jgi:hypothetical protein
MLADPGGGAATQNPGRSEQSLVASVARDPGKPAQSQERFVHSLFYGLFFLVWEMWAGWGYLTPIRRRFFMDDKMQ